jgi:hypothetical protein
MMIDGHTMRRGSGASTTGKVIVLLAAFCVASCQKAAARPLPQEPPARALLVTDGRISLRSTAWSELHAWLIGAARDEGEVDPDLEPARRAYARSLAKDDQDELVDRTTRAMARCEDERCAIAAVAAEGFGSSFARALPTFEARGWIVRGKTASVGLEAAKSALGSVDGAEALLLRAASDLGMTLPERALPVAVVSEAPPVGRDALAPAVLATRSRCFMQDGATRDRSLSRDHARMLDCIFVHALLATDERGTLHDALVRELGERTGKRAWSLLVIHAVAAVVTAWDPRHRSVYRRSAEAVEREMLEWLATQWRGKPTNEFAAEYVARWRAIHPTTR